MTPEDAEEYTRSLGLIGEGWWRQVLLADNLGVPSALGLGLREWGERVGAYAKLGIPLRREAVAELAAQGLPQHKIADVLGVSQMTVSRDLAETNVSGAGPACAKDETTNETIVSDGPPLLSVVDLETGEIMATAEEWAEQRDAVEPEAFPVHRIEPPSDEQVAEWRRAESAKMAASFVATLEREAGWLNPKLAPESRSAIASAFADDVALAMRAEGAISAIRSGIESVRSLLPSKTAQLRRVQ